MKKIRVKIAVAVSDEAWAAWGSSLKAKHNMRHEATNVLCTDANQHIVWIEALVPLPPEPPAETVVRGRVK